VLLVTATLPLLADIATLPLASGAGKLAPSAPAAVPSCTRKYWPGATLQGPVGQTAVTDQAPVPVADAYCTDQPARLTGEAPRLKSSTKSFL
jgi:hypothetical protein